MRPRSQVVAKLLASGSNPVCSTVAGVLLALVALSATGCADRTASAADDHGPELGADESSDHSTAGPTVRQNEDHVDAKARERAWSEVLWGLGQPQTRDGERVGHALSTPNHAHLVEALYARDGWPRHFTTDDGLLSQRGRSMLGVVEEDARTHVIDPERLHASAIRARIAPRDDPADERRRVAELELLLADALLTFADVMRHGNRAVDSDARRTEAGDERLVRNALLAEFERAMDARPGQLRDHLLSLAPRFEQYQRLVTVLAYYRDIARKGGWPTIEVDPEDMPVRRGQHGEHIAALQKRLAIEGYYEGEIDSRYGSDLRRATIEYQRTHQLGDNGVLEAPDLASLNRSAAMRVAQIEVAIQRWRESRIGNDEYYVHISIPDFHGELWHAGERLARFPVIVGNTRRYFEEGRGEHVFINATPLISADMDFLIFNPYWTPTPRIVRELKRKLEEEPDYLVNNGFVIDDEGRIRQLPGPDNVLGQVKFQLPNRYDIYMHDTDKRYLFKHPVRAFSHGCIRVKDPLELAEHIFERDGRSDPERSIERYLEPGREDWTELRDGTIPVHIEYYGVRVDAEGRAHFGADIYRYDRPRVAARLLAMGEDVPWRDDADD